VSIVPPPSLLVIPVAPLHKTHPVGIDATVPYHGAIKPIGIWELVTLFITRESALTSPFTFNLKLPGSSVPIPMLPPNVSILVVILLIPVFF
jgi:hypothetical protein